MHVERIVGVIASNALSSSLSVWYADRGILHDRIMRIVHQACRREGPLSEARLDL